MNELNAAIQARLEGMTAASTLARLQNGGIAPAICHKQAPEGQAFPYIVYNSFGNDDNETQNRTKNKLVTIIAYSGVSDAQAGTIDAAIDAACHLVPLTVSGWTNFWMARETDIELIENQPSGKRIYAQGADYRVRLDKE